MGISIGCLNRSKRIYRGQMKKAQINTNNKYGICLLTKKALLMKGKRIIRFLKMIYRR